MAEHNDTLYLVSADEVLASTDSGETWKSLGARPKGPLKGLAVTDEAFYLTLDKGIFRSTDSGKQWTLLKDVGTDTEILAVANIENTVFVGTTEGLHRISAGAWEKLSIDTTKAIHSLAVSENHLYVGTGPDFAQLQTPEGIGAYMGQIMSSDTSSSWEIFHSTDLGDTWTEITPTSDSFMMKISPGVKVIAAGKTILALGITAFRSTDGGKTWIDFGFDRSDLNSAMNSFTLSLFPAVGVDENTFFKVGPLGLIRSTDAGESWHPFMTGIVGTHIQDLVAFKNDLYANTWIGIVKSTDGGASWETLNLNSDELTLKSTANVNFTNLLMFPKLAISGGVLYGITPRLEEENELHLFHLSVNGNVLVPIQAVPTFGKDSPFIIDIIRQLDSMHQREKYPGAFAVNGDTFYVEYKRRLFRWKRGDSEWFNTGLIDTGKNPDEEDDFIRGFKLAVFGKTVYVGKRDGHLFQSLDGGDTWKDVTTNLPLRFERFNDITFADSTVYVATDAGTLMSKEGEHWRALTDKTGANTITDRVTVGGTTIYGAGNEGIHQLNKRGEWEKISPEVPDRVISLVPNSDRLYIATKQRGIFHTSIEKVNN